MAVMTLSVSSSLSLSVLTESMAVDEPAAMVTEVGAVPLIIAPLSVTPTVTLRLEVVAPVRVTVNVAAVPSDTGEVPALILTSGVVGGVVLSLSLTVTVAEDDVPRS